MNQIRALAIDLDGTLIGPDESISPAVAEAVRRTAELIHISIVTGRESDSVLRYAGELGLTSPQVADNGALILNPQTGDEVWSAPMGRDLARQALEPIVETGCRFMATNASGIVTDVDEIADWELTRVTAFDLTDGEADRMIRAMAEVENLEAVRAFLPYNGLWAVNFNRRGVNKGTGLRALCGLLGIEASQVAAVGDSFNDIPMFQVSGLSMAMGDAPVDVRGVADLVVGGFAEDGLADAIHRYVLPHVRPAWPDDPINLPTAE